MSFNFLNGRKYCNSRDVSLNYINFISILRFTMFGDENFLIIHSFDSNEISRFIGQIYKFSNTFSRYSSLMSWLLEFINLAVKDVFFSVGYEDKGATIISPITGQVPVAHSSPNCTRFVLCFPCRYAWLRQQIPFNLTKYLALNIWKKLYFMPTVIKHFNSRILLLLSGMY